VALDDIYKEVILDHYKNPRNKRDLPGAEVSCTRNNPLCGDEITVFAHVDDGTVAELTFQGAGCSISQSSASMMTEAAAGRTVDQTLELAGQFRGMMAGEVEPDPDQVRRARVGRVAGGAPGHRRGDGRAAAHGRLRDVRGSKGERRPRRGAWSPHPPVR